VHRYPVIYFDPNSSEDCLTLNVWLPFTQYEGGELKPVLVWFYGGLWDAYTDCHLVYADGVFADPKGRSQVRGKQYGSDLLRDQDEGGNALVSMVCNPQIRKLPQSYNTYAQNYRLGSLGFLNGQQMVSLLNLGMLYQRQALY